MTIKDLFGGEMSKKDVVFSRVVEMG